MAARPAYRRCFYVTASEFGNDGQLSRVRREALRFRDLQSDLRGDGGPRDPRNTGLRR